MTIDAPQIFDFIFKLIGIAASIITPYLALRRLHETNRAKERERKDTMKKAEADAKIEEDKAEQQERADLVRGLRDLIRELARANTNNEENRELEKARIDLHKTDNEETHKQIASIKDEFQKTGEKFATLTENVTKTVQNAAKTNLTGYTEALTGAMSEQKKNGDAGKQEILNHIDQAKQDIEKHVDDKLELLRAELLKAITPDPKVDPAPPPALETKTETPPGRPAKG